MKKLLNLTLMAGLLAALMLAAPVGAAPPPQGGEDYTVQADDWLSKLADKFFGDINAWPAIMAATNQAAVADSSYVRIENADLIEIGQKLRIPTADEAQAFMNTFDFSKPELLYGKGAAGQVIVASWWTAGGEADGLFAMYDIYKAQNPDVQIVNAATAGGAGSNFKAVNTTRILGGDPPDTFQVHVGRELLDTWVIDPNGGRLSYMEPITFIFEQNGWMDKYPPGVLDLITWDGDIWQVPVNIHRANVLWYNKAVFEANGLTAPTNFDEFFAAADTLQAAGVTPLALGDSGIWASTHLMETVLLGTLGADGYGGLWTGATDWNSPEVTTALTNFTRMLDYVNSDHAALTWDQAAQLVADGDAAMTIMGDWTEGYYISKGLTPDVEFGWAPSPGTNGVFDALSDSFGLPVGAPNRDATIAWLAVAGSKEGQEAFNPLKGSICARIDCDPSLFDAYLQSAMQDWATNTIAPSLAHGAAASESWVTEINDIVSVFVTDRDVASAQAGFAQACVNAGVCQ